MIKTEYGNLKLRGTKSDLYADLGVIIRYLVTKDIITKSEIRILVDSAPMIGTEAVTHLSGKFGEAETKTEKAKENVNADRLGELIKKLERIIDQAID